MSRHHDSHPSPEAPAAPMPQMSTFWNPQHAGADGTFDPWAGTGSQAAYYAAFEDAQTKYMDAYKQWIADQQAAATAREAGS